MVLIDFGSFSHLLEKYELFIKLSKTSSFLAIFEQKAWAIAHGFDGFWVIFTPFGKIMNYLSNFQKQFIFGHFWAKSMGYSPWFWWILGHFHTFWKNNELFIKLSKTSSFLAIFEQKAWAIAHGFDGFWVIFTPFGKIWIIYQAFKNVSFLAIFEQKAWAIAHGFDGFWVIFTPFGKIYE